MAQNGVERPFSAICVHYCIPTGRPRDPRAAIVYTNGPERRRKTAFANLCTLLRPPASPPAARATPAPQQCTQMVQNSSVRPFSAICVHYCVPLRHQGAPARPPCRNSVHKCPGTAPRGRFRRSVYTIASPCVTTAARVTLAPQQCTQMPRNGVERPFSAICVHYCVPLCPHRPPARASRRNSVHNHEAPNIPAPGRRTSPRSG